MTELQADLINIVRERQRCVTPTRGVLPKTAQCFLDWYRCEQTLRRDFNTLAAQGLLVRVGGPQSRKGYRIAVPSPAPMPVPAPKPVIQWIPSVSQWIRVA